MQGVKAGPRPVEMTPKKKMKNKRGKKEEEEDEEDILKLVLSIKTINKNNK